MTKIESMKRRSVMKIALLFLCATGILGGCSNADTKQRPATFDGDLRLSGETKDFYSQHRVVTLNGHDLHQRQSARVRDQRINCLLRDCKLQPGKHITEVEYFWSSIEAEKRNRRSEAWRVFGFVLGTVSGAGGDAPDNSRHFPCQASVSFEVQSAHDYRLNVVHTEQAARPEEIQIVDTASGVVVGSIRPSCY